MIRLPPRPTLTYPLFPYPTLVRSPAAPSRTDSNAAMTATPAAAHALVQPLSDWAFGPAPRRNTRQVRIGGVAVGGDAPVVVQSMTNTDTADVASTVKQVADLWRAGSELVRVTVNNPESAAAVPRIVEIGREHV